MPTPTNGIDPSQPTHRAAVNESNPIQSLAVAHAVNPVESDQIPIAIARPVINDQREPSRFPATLWVRDAADSSDCRVALHQRPPLKLAEKAVPLENIARKISSKLSNAERWRDDGRTEWANNELNKAAWGFQ